MKTALIPLSSAFVALYDNSEHNLRHTFAVRCLLRWYREGANVDQKIAALATYLGHVNVTKTYWYLTAVPELLAIVGSRFEEFSHAQTGGAHEAR
ncbi:MAG: hypothetical protein HY645_11625 [Acidobacteria bacterium]|nr:hypothetical protein [Acidobacteriota bacterium]